MKQDTIKNIIKEHATKNNMFLRILKELRMYKIYFRLLDKYGHTEKCSSTGEHIEMATLIMNGFCWENDKTRFRYSWVELYELLSTYSVEIETIKKIGINELKKNNRWNKIKSMSINKPQ